MRKVRASGIIQPMISYLLGEKQRCKPDARLRGAENGPNLRTARSRKLDIFSNALRSGPRNARVLAANRTVKCQRVVTAPDPLARESRARFYSRENGARGNGPLLLAPLPSSVSGISWARWRLELVRVRGGEGGAWEVGGVRCAGGRLALSSHLADDRLRRRKGGSAPALDEPVVIARHERRAPRRDGRRPCRARRSGGQFRRTVRAREATLERAWFPLLPHVFVH